MKRWWAVVMGGTLFLSGCTRVAPDPCRGVAPPVATFRVSPEEGELPLLVTFDAGDSFASEGQIVGYQWEFGDGVTGTGPVVQHVFDRDPDGLEEQEFSVTLTVTQEAATEGGVCRRTSPAMRVLRYGKSYPLDVVRWELGPEYYGSLIEGVVRNASADQRVTHAEVYARFYREPGHVLVGEAHRELWDIRPGEERIFMIPTYLWPGQFDWVELRTEAFTAPP